MLAGTGRRGHGRRSVVPREEPFLLSTLPPTREQERLATIVAVALLIAFIGTLPFTHRQLPHEYPFVSFVDTFMFLNDLITAALLYAQFSVARTWGLLSLACGYLFTSLIIVPHALTFPGLFAPMGLLGAGLQSTVWLYIFWHVGIAVGAIAYALLKSKPISLPAVRRSAGVAIVGSIAIIGVLTAALTWIITASATLLPPIMVDTISGNGLWRNILGPLLIVVFFVAILLMWKRRSSVLDLWLLVALWAWLIELMLLKLTPSRFSLIWYAGKFFGISSSSFVLLALLAESTVLYARLATSVAAQAREREGRRMSMEVMVASIAHELHQPLSAIVANSTAEARMLVRTPPDWEEVRATVEDISRDGRRASEIIESIRAMFSVGIQERALLDINDLVHETLAILRIELKTHGISLAIEPVDPPLVRGNKGQLLQVFLNVITNAIDSMAEISDRAHLLRIQYEVRDSRVSLLVEDSGTGVDPKSAARIFEPFFTTKSKGMGLGLAICKSIIDSHGGSLSVTPASRFGSVFRIDLPIAAAKSPSTVEQRALAS
jgi:signal transduction histidine kinase